MKKPFNERIKALKTIVKRKQRTLGFYSFNTEEFRIECPLKMAKQTLIESEEQMDKLYKDKSLKKEEVL